MPVSTENGCNNSGRQGSFSVCSLTQQHSYTCAFTASMLPDLDDELAVLATFPERCDSPTESAKFCVCEQSQLSLVSTQGVDALV